MIDQSEIVNIQFGVSLSNSSEYRFVPVDVNVQGVLKEILINTQDRVNANIVGLREYEPSEKYTTRETLYISLLDEHLEYLQSLFNNTSITIDSTPIESYISQIEFYFVFFTLRNNTKILGVKRSTQFKSLLKSRMVRFVDDTLKNVEDSVFKLDEDFDYYVYDGNVFINQPSGFQYTTHIEEFVQERAFEATNNLITRVPFIKFTSLANFVKGSKTSAKLIASIKKRQDLEQIDRKKLLAFCKKLNIQIKVNADNSIEPEFEDKYQDFLMVLDRRIFEYNLISNIKELYEAPSRIQKQN